MRKLLALCLVLTPLLLTGCFDTTDGNGDGDNLTLDNGSALEEASESAAVEAAERGNQ